MICYTILGMSTDIKLSEEKEYPTIEDMQTQLAESDSTQ